MTGVQTCALPILVEESFDGALRGREAPVKADRPSHSSPDLRPHVCTHMCTHVCTHVRWGCPAGAQAPPPVTQPHYRPQPGPVGGSRSDGTGEQGLCQGSSSGSGENLASSCPGPQEPGQEARKGVSAGAECLLWDWKPCGVPGTPSFLICKVGEGIFSQAPWLLRKGGEDTKKEI